MTSEKYTLNGEIYETGKNKKVGKIYFTEEIDKYSGIITYKVYGIEIPKQYKVPKEKFSSIKSNTYKQLSMKIDSILLPYKLYMV